MIGTKSSLPLGRADDRRGMAGLRDDAGIVVAAGQHEVHVSIEQMDELHGCGDAAIISSSC